MDLEKEVAGVIKESVAEAVRKHMNDYGSPLKTMVFDAIKVHDGELRKFIYEAVGEVFSDDEFRTSAKKAIKHKVARELTGTFGEGIFKRSIDQLKSDPLIRARCVQAIERIITEPTEQEP